MIISVKTMVKRSWEVMYVNKENAHTVIGKLLVT
jgi:hypothetical protein